MLRASMNMILLLLFILIVDVLKSFQFLLRLDPEDPLAILLMVDFFALKAEQYDYILQLFNEWEV